MTLADFDHVSTDQARTLRDSAERLAVKALREKGEKAPEVAAAWLVFRTYSLVVSAREAQGCR